MAQEDRLRSAHSLKVKLLRIAWAAVEMTLFRCSFHTMYRWRSFWLRCFGAKIGRQCKIRRTVRVYYPWNLDIGDKCIVGDDAQLYDLGKITIGTGALISQEAYLCAGTHDHTDLALPLLTPPVTVGPQAWICARAFVGPGVTVAEGAIVAACGVAVKDVPPWTIVGGNPAKIIGKREVQSADNKTSAAAKD